MLSYTDLLTIATAKTSLLEKELEYLNASFENLTVQGNPQDWHNLFDYKSKKEASYAEILLKEKEIRRSQIREDECRRNIANGATREVLELVRN